MHVSATLSIKLQMVLCFACGYNSKATSCCEFLYIVQGVQTQLYDSLVVLGMTDSALLTAFYVLVLFQDIYAHRPNLHHPSFLCAFDFVPLLWCRSLCNRRSWSGVLTPALATVVETSHDAGTKNSSFGSLLATLVGTYLKFKSFTPWQVLNHIGTSCICY